MTELHTPGDGRESALDPTESVAAESVAAESSGGAEDFHPNITPAPVLITEHEVSFGTAAALHRPPAQARPARGRRYPPRSASYYDTSLMSREAHRL